MSDRPSIEKVTELLGQFSEDEQREIMWGVEFQRGMKPDPAGKAAYERLAEPGLAVFDQCKGLDLIALNALKIAIARYLRAVQVNRKMKRDSALLTFLMAGSDYIRETAAANLLAEKGEEAVKLDGFEAEFANARPLHFEIITPKPKAGSLF